MKFKEFWEGYRELTLELSGSIPAEVSCIGDFIIKWSPFIALILLFFMLIDKLFERATVKFIAKGFVRICEKMWENAQAEPNHQGLITEAHPSVQIVFHRLSAVYHGFFGTLLLLYSLFIFVSMLTMEMKPEHVPEGYIVLSVLIAASIFVGFVQLGLCRQSVILARTVPRNEQSIVTDSEKAPRR